MSAQTALITGGAIRIGRAIAEQCAEMGMRLVIHYHSSEHAAFDFSQVLSEQGVEHCLVQCDLSDNSAVNELFESIPKAFRPIDVLINSAAVFPEEDELVTFEQQWDWVTRINSYAPIALAKQFAQQKGHTSKTAPAKHIINILDARLNQVQSDHFVYRLSKAVLQQATKDLALSLAPDIQVNGIALGAILPPPGKGQDHLNRLASHIPLARTGSVELVKSTLQFLLSNSFITGDIIHLDGGEFLTSPK